MPTIPYWCDRCQAETDIVTRITDTPKAYHPCALCNHLSARKYTPTIFTVSIGHIEGKFGRYNVKDYDYLAEECWPDRDATPGRVS